MESSEHDGAAGGNERVQGRWIVPRKQRQHVYDWKQFGYRR